MELFALNVLSVGLELLIYYYFFHLFFGKARFSKPVMFTIYLIVAVVSVYLSNTNLNGLIQEIGYFLVIIVLALCYWGQLFFKLFWSGLFQITSTMVEDCYYIILLPVRTQLLLYGLTGSYFYYFLGVVLSNLTILLFLRLLSSWKNSFFQREENIDVPVCFMVLFFFPASMLFVIHQYMDLIKKTNTADLQNMLPVFVLTGITIVFFFFFDFVLRARQNRLQMKTLQWQLEQERQYHEILLNKHQQFQGLRHDMKNHFILLAGLIKNGHEEEALQYAQLQAGQLAFTSAVQTGHPLLDTILTIKEEQARQIQTQFQCHVLSSLQISGIELDDLASLLSNILDNALEAVREIPNTGQRKIWCKLMHKNDYLHIIVRNTVQYNVDVTDNMVKTTKSNQSLHGFGLQNVKRVVEKYGGAYRLECKNRIFSVKVLLPVKSEKSL